MMKSILLSIALNFTLLSPAFADDITFPESVFVSYNDQQMELFMTGQAVRKKFFLEIYSIAHYLELEPEIVDEYIYQRILQPKGVKQISIIFLRALSADKIKKNLLASIKLNYNDEEYKLIASDTESFMYAINDDVEKHDEFILRWFPDGTTVSIFQGREISSIKNDRFAMALWSIWFGEHAVVDKQELVRQMLTSS